LTVKIDYQALMHHSELMSTDAAEWRASELLRRVKMWASLCAGGGPTDVSASIIRELEIYKGQAGIYFDSKSTRSQWASSGVAVSFLQTGSSYDDDVSSDGMLYHYPSTLRKGSHDENEVNSAKSARDLGLPIFIISPGSNDSCRTVRIGYVETFDDLSKLLLVTFTDALETQLLVPGTDDNFDPFGSVGERTQRWVRERPNQSRFAMEVFRIYGTGCAVCDFNVPGIVEAAHLAPKAKGGLDDGRNGLPLCANHHRALDRKLWSIDPTTTLLSFALSTTKAQLAICRDDLTHLTTRPHCDVLKALS
jgi:putative restriction endonuclease